MRLAPLIPLILCLVVARDAAAQWQLDGTPVCNTTNGKAYPLIATDGLGGAFVGWVNYGNADDVFVQHITAAGLIVPGWPGAGVAASTAPGDQYISSLVGDGLGGVFVVWSDFRQGVTNGYDVYAQHVLGTGVVDARWPVDGLAIAAYPETQWGASVVSDGAGGAFVVWQDRRNGGPGTDDVYLQHVLEDGSLAPGWPVGGKPVCTAPGEQEGISMVADGQGGVFLAWGDNRNATTTSYDVYAIRLTNGGEPAAGWTSGGIPICTAPNIQDVTRTALDGNGGFYVAWEDTRSEPPWDPDYRPYVDVYLQRVTGSGAIASGWPADGFPVCTATFLQQDIHLTSDGSGGALLVWSDQRSFYTADAYAQRVTAAGAVASGWPVDGLQASTAPGYQGSTAIAADGLGGAYVAFSSLTDFYQVYAQHLTATGGVAPGWPADGVRLALTAGEQQHPSMTADGYGGAIVTWDDSRPYQIYAQQLLPDGVGPVPVLVSLVSAAAAPDRVAITWQVTGAAGTEFRADRRGVTTAWARLGPATREGADRLRFEDRGVRPGERYAYRLGCLAGGGEQYSAETWVEVPRAAELALEGLRPNPAVADLNAAFSLPSAAPATLELVDVGGRRVLCREVGSLGAGRHVLRLADRGSVAAGLYWLRLQQGGRSLTARAVVVR